MRPRFFSLVNASQPFTAALNDGLTPTQIKKDIITLLDPYVFDKKLLEERAIDLFSIDAVSFGRLSTRTEWKAFFDIVFALRREAFVIDENRAVAIMSFFQAPIQETQSKFALQMTFEQRKDDMSLEEYAFEIFRNIGALIESTLQPFLKEFYCLACLCRGSQPSPAAVSMEDFGKIVVELEKLVAVPELVAPNPWGLRLNQWRNIAQHHTYKIANNRIVAEYGKSSPPKKIELTKDELRAVAIEVNARLGILKTSRFLSVVNNIDLLRPFLADTEEDVSVTCLVLASSFATQGFRVTKIDYTEEPVIVHLIDDAPLAGSRRYIHCSQFFLPIASHFPGRAVEIQLRTSDDRPQWTFRLERDQLEQVLSDKEPFAALGQAIDWKKALTIAKANGVKIRQPTI